MDEQHRSNALEHHRYPIAKEDLAAVGAANRP
jgi:hypothetical protein